MSVTDSVVFAGTDRSAEESGCGGSTVMLINQGGEDEMVGHLFLIGLYQHHHCVYRYYR